MRIQWTNCIKTKNSNIWYDTLYTTEESTLPPYNDSITVPIASRGSPPLAPVAKLLIQKRLYQSKAGIAAAMNTYNQWTCAYNVHADLHPQIARGFLRGNDTMLGEWRLFGLGWIMGRLLRPSPSGSRAELAPSRATAMQGRCWHWQIRSRIKALSRTKLCHNGPLGARPYAPRPHQHPTSPRNNSVDFLLRIQAHSRTR